MAGASVETALELRASALRDVKARMQPLFTQGRVAASAGLFLDSLPGNARRKSGWMRAEAAATRPVAAAGDPGPRPPAGRCVARHRARWRLSRRKPGSSNIRPRRMGLRLLGSFGSSTCERSLDRAERLILAAIRAQAGLPRIGRSRNLISSPKIKLSPATAPIFLDY